MKIRVGILGRNVSGWNALLRQIGVPFRQAAGTLAAAEWSAVVVADDARTEEISSAREYLRAGGAVLCSGTVHALLTGEAPGRRSLRYLLQDEAGGEFPGIGLVDVSAPCVVPAGANCVQAADGRPAVLVGPFGAGTLVALPFDAPTVLEDPRCTYKSFWADRRRLPFEYLSHVSRGGVRSLVARALELLHHRRGLPFVHLWHFPGNARSVLAFRIDTDHGTAAEIDSLASLLHRHDVRATWFVHVGAQEKLLPRFAALEGHEIGVHCYEHEAFHDPAAIDRDLERAQAAMRSAGIPFTGYAGPYGRWSTALARSVARHGFEYSSEFSYDYDNLPSFPMEAGKAESVLQVPIHPISIGSLRRQGCTSDEMRQYFARTVDRILAAGDPLFFYHHPKNLHPDVLESLFGRMKEEKVGTILLGEYARWWKVRESVALEAETDGDRVTLASAGSAGNVQCRITRSDGTETWAPVGGSVELRSLAWTPVRTPAALPKGVERTRKFNPWIPLNRLENAFHRKFLS